MHCVVKETEFKKSKELHDKVALLILAFGVIFKYILSTLYTLQRFFEDSIFLLMIR